MISTGSHSAGRNYIKSLILVKLNTVKRIMRLDEHAWNRLSILKLNISEVSDVERKNIVILSVIPIHVDLVSDIEYIRRLASSDDLSDLI